MANEQTLILTEAQIIGILTGEKTSIASLPVTAKIIDVSYDNDRDEMYIKYIVK